MLNKEVLRARFVDMGIILEKILKDLHNNGFDAIYLPYTDQRPVILAYQNYSCVFRLEISHESMIDVIHIDQLGKERGFPLSHPNSIDNAVSYCIKRWGNE